MIRLCSFIRVVRVASKPLCHQKLRHVPNHVRGIASTAKSTSASPPSSSPLTSAFGGLSNELDNLAPRFEVSADQIEILKEPGEFYEVLKTKILAAKRRIYISTLYIGKTENELITTIRTALSKNPGLKISFLTDALRGTREAPKPTCASLLAPLVAEFGSHRVQIRMFHTPNLTGLRKAVLPVRINEGWGLQHMKLYGFDDELIISGANLSSDYFTNRQDRYHLLRSKTLTDYYERIHDAVSSISFDIQPSETASSGFAMTWPSSHSGPSPLENPKTYIRHASSLLTPLIKPSAVDDVENPSAKSRNKQTTIYPLFQFTPILPATPISPAPSTELPALELLLRSLGSKPFAPARWTFTAGYFNMTPFIRDLLLSSLRTFASTASERDQDLNQSTGTIITAHPHANGFFGSKGLTGLLPAAYTLMARRFMFAVDKASLQDHVSLHEWKRGMVGEADGWTYHAKGIWVTLSNDRSLDSHDERASNAPNQAGPAITLIGSSNYTQRSHTLDLEANALILTTDNGLKARLKDEEEHLMQHAGPRIGLEELQKPERRVGLRVRIALWVTALIGGAL